LAPGTYSVKVWVFHLGFRRHETVTVRTFEVPAGEMTTQQLAVASAASTWQRRTTTIFRCWR
jgi:hypothetical protein